MTTTALLYTPEQAGIAHLVQDLQVLRVQVLGAHTDLSACRTAMAQCQPNVLICDVPKADEHLWGALPTLHNGHQVAVVVWTQDASQRAIEAALAAGVHAYEVDGYSVHRLGVVLRVAQARCMQMRLQQEALQDLAQRLEDRKMVDRAKGILMHARQLSDEAAFQILRTTSMHTNQRLGQVSQFIIQSAQLAHDVNRSGQLRMLSQRVVKLYGLQHSGVLVKHSKALLQASVQHVNDNLALLSKSVDEPQATQLLESVCAVWERLQSAVLPVRRRVALAQVAQAHDVDALAEQVLALAEKLTAHLEGQASTAPLQLLNVAGRQRMLSQRFAKFALLALQPVPSVAEAGRMGMQATQEAFEQALRYLHSMPLSSLEIRASLEAADTAWQQLMISTQQAFGADRMQGLERSAHASEDLLEIFEALSIRYEHSMQMLLGG